MGRSTHGMPRTSWHLAQRPYEGFRRQVAVRADLGARPDGRADGCAGGSRHVLTVNTARGRAPRVVGPSGAAGGVVLCPPARGRGEVQPRGVLAPRVGSARPPRTSMGAPTLRGPAWAWVTTVGGRAGGGNSLIPRTRTWRAIVGGGVAGGRLRVHPHFGSIEADGSHFKVGCARTPIRPLLPPHSGPLLVRNSPHLGQNSTK